MARSKDDLSLLPNQKEIDAVSADVKTLMQDQIKAAGGLKDRGAAEEFARNLKARVGLFHSPIRISKVKAITVR